MIGVAPVEKAIVTKLNVPIELVSLVPDEDVRPISPPVLVYPAKAAQRLIEGTCDVRMDVSPRGEPFNIQPNCSHNVFNSEATRAMSRVQFRPKIYRGQAVERRNVIYPLVFDLS
jgi:protein TonB